MSKTNEQIGELIKSVRKEKGLTQKDFASLLKTSQSAVARFESGRQNLTTNEIKKISKVLGRNLISIDESIDFRIRGGKKLHGEITTNTSKNGAMGLLCASLLNKGKTVLHKVPRIEEVNRMIEVFESIGINCVWSNNNTLTIKVPEKIKIKEIDFKSAQKVRSILMMIGPLLHHFEKFKIPHSGGCKMGSRTIAAHKYGLEEFGVSIETKEDYYEIFSERLSPSDVVMYEAGDTAVINVILTAALLDGETNISFASSNYQVQEVCFFLKELGVEIEGVGTHKLKIRNSKFEIRKDIEFTLSEDPIEAMMFISAAIVTNSKLKINRCPIDFLSLELLKLKKMGLNFKKTKIYKGTNGYLNLVDLIILPSKLKALHDKIHPLPYPGINVDNLPFFVPIVTQAEGQTLIHDWMWENRAIYFTELNKLGADVKLADPHRVFIDGKTELKPAQVVCPPALRPAMIILIAMLGANGESILRNVYSIKRGYEDVANRLNSIGADIEII